MSDLYHTVIVSFECQPEEQDEALGKIGAYVGDFLSKQPGFVESHLSRSLDGVGIVHYARWETEANFLALGEKARSHPDLPAIMAHKPTAVRHVSWQSYRPD